MIENFKGYEIKSFTGISDYLNKGISGAFKFGQNLNVRSDTDCLQAGQALTDDLATGTMTGLALFSVNADDGNSYEFCDDGKIFKRASNGTRTLVYTDANGRITGACQWYNDNGSVFLYWTTATRLNRKAIPGSSDWSDANATVNGQTYPKTDLTSATWHTMAIVNGTMYICNANKIATVAYDDSYSTEALRLLPDSVSKCIMEYNNNAYIGCGVSSNTSRGHLFVWDASQSLNYDNIKRLPNTPVNALIDPEIPLMQVGDDGEIKMLTDSMYTLPLRKFPGGGSVNPHGVYAVDFAYFGSFGNSVDADGSTVRSGVYTYGRNKHNSSIVLNLEHLFDCDEIGYINKVGDDLLISYKDGSNYGVKKVDASNKATGLYRSPELVHPGVKRQGNWSAVKLTFEPLPSGCSISVRRSINLSNSWTSCNLLGGSETTFSTANSTEAWFMMGDKGKFCEIEITLTPSGNYTPKIRSVIVGYE